MAPRQGGPRRQGSISVSLRDELRHHAPFTALGAVSGMVLALLLLQTGDPQGLSRGLFTYAHPLHVLLSATATANLAARRLQGRALLALLVGFFGSIGIATLSDSAVPYLGEWLLQMPHRAAHIGFLENAWLVHGAALLGAGFGIVIPRTRLPHGGHVFVSTAASLFHMIMALGATVSLTTLVGMGAFLFLAVWLPCCTSDIVLPMLVPALPRHGAEAPPFPEPQTPCEHAPSRRGGPS